MAIALTVSATAMSADAGPNPQDEEVRRILAATDVKGGLIVHFGCGDGKLIARLGADDRYIVHGLDVDAENVAKARARIRAQGLYGRVSADRFDGRKLPYIDNLVNLFLARDLGDLPLSEIERALCPNGVAFVQRNGRWSKTVKPWPKEIDEWPHYLHDPQGTMVSSDEVVGLPRRLQWAGGPKWMRNHDFMASLSGMVSSGGRIFYIVDEGLRNHVYLPARWAVVARDAFNGTILWKRRIDSWFPHTFPFKSGPGHLPRRIVADGGRVYVTLGITTPLSILDAATGETIRTCDRTRATEEIVLADGVLYLLVDPDKGPFPYQHASDNRGQERNRVNQEFGWSKESPDRLVMAVSADTGEVLWTHKDNIAPLTLALNDENVFFYDGEHVVALERKSGRKRWDSQAAGDSTTPWTGYAPRLIVGDGVVVLSTKKMRGGRLVGVSTENGEVIWRSEQLGSGHWSPEDLYLVNGVVWTAQTGGSQTQGTHFQAVDAKTGETRHDFVAKNWEVFFMHQRCYPGRATKRYIMTSGTGTEFLELGTEYCELHHWLRGACIYGLMPANGLLYKTPDSCACYYQSKLPHMCALAPPSDETRVKASRRDRLEKGPAYGDGRSQLGDLDAESWPTYRSDSARSGATAVAVPAEVRKLWQVETGGKLSTMTAADGKLFVAAVDRHTVYALDADSGGAIWS
ncbi:MAG: outer membrane protein assembly factor BamB family protein, partial [Planctomycetota bacterium]